MLGTVTNCSGRYQLLSTQLMAYGTGYQLPLLGTCEPRLPYVVLRRLVSEFPSEDVKHSASHPTSLDMRLKHVDIGMHLA